MIEILFEHIKNCLIFKIFKVVALLYLKIKKGVVGKIIKLKTWNFGKLSIFKICWNGIGIMLSYSSRFPILKIALKSSVHI